MQVTLKRHIKKHSICIKDGWVLSTKAIKESRDMGYKLLPPVVHKKHFRDPNTGLHSNDAESEINRVKSWMRKKYALIRGEELKNDLVDGIPRNTLSYHLDEFMCLKNAGDTMDSIMETFRFNNGQRFRPVQLR